MKKEDVIVVLLKEKNEDAFEYVYEKYNKLVFLVINNIVKDKEVSKELTSDTFLRMYKSIDTFSIGKNFQPWLTTIARNIAINYLNRSKDANIIYDESIVLKHEDISLKGKALGIIENILDGIEYEVVKLKIINNCTYRDISQILSMSTAEVFRKYRSGITKIRIAIKNR